MARIAVNRERMADFCRQHHIRRLSFFGSVLRDDFGPESDIDLLVEFEPGQTPGLLALVRMEDEFAELLGLGRKVDLRTAQDLSQYFRDEVVAHAEEVCAAA
jgi:uncharacterized protein